MNSVFTCYVPVEAKWHLGIFHSSGMIGSGLCVFSKFPIAETFQRRYSLNGYPHRYQHGDWFGGKAVGLAQILMDEFKLNVYVTHVSKIY